MRHLRAIFAANPLRRNESLPMRSLIVTVFVLLTYSLRANETDTCSNQYTLRDSIVNYAQNYIGTKYLYGGVNPTTGFDCSGFVMYVFRKFGIQLPHASRSMADTGNEKPRENAEVGDIIVFQGRSTTTVGHVGIVYNTPGGEVIFIHSSSPRSGGVIFSSLDESYYKQRFIKIIDVLS